MIETLYDDFKEWGRNGAIWLISDTHFDDEDCKYMDLNWPTPQEHIKEIKRCLGPNDTLIHLGDVGNAEYLRGLKCHKVLITGNHDVGATKYKIKPKYIETYECADDAHKALKEHKVDFIRPATNDGYKWDGIFNEVYTGPLQIAEKIILSHEPLREDWALNIHGHLHAHHEEWQDEFHYCISANLVGYKKINLNDIIKSGALKPIISIHRQTIDAAAERKKIEEKNARLKGIMRG